MVAFDSYLKSNTNYIALNEIKQTMVFYTLIKAETRVVLNFKKVNMIFYTKIITQESLSSAMYNWSNPPPSISLFIIDEFSILTAHALIAASKAKHMHMVTEYVNTCSA